MTYFQSFDADIKVEVIINVPMDPSEINDEHDNIFDVDVEVSLCIYPSWEVAVD